MTGKMASDEQHEEATENIDTITTPADVTAPSRIREYN